MKIFAVLLAYGLFGLSVSEKLSRGYLPPPGAKYAGGDSGDLQIPLEHPKETSVYRSGFDEADKGPSFLNGGVRINDNGKLPEQPNKSSIFKSVLEKDTYRPEYKNGFTRKNYNDATPGVEEPLPKIISENPYGYTESYVVGGSATTVPPLGLETDTVIENIDGSINNKYPMNGAKFIPKQGQYENPKSGITSSDDIIQNYQPKAFGMYGGSPMMAKTFTELSTDSQPDNRLRSNLMQTNYPSNDLSISDESYSPVSQKSTLTATSFMPNYITPKKSVNAMVPSPKNIVKSHKYKKLERPRGEIDRNAVVLSYKNVQTPEGYAYNFETSNGIKKDESATTMNGVEAQGSYSYIGDDGKVYSLSYVADENGFQPKGDHLPTPPPIPEAIQRVIEQALRNKEAGIIHDGSYDDKKYGHMKYEGPVSRYLQNIKMNTEVKNPDEVIVGKQIKNPIFNAQTPINISSERRSKPVINLKSHEIKHDQDNQRGVINYDSSPKTNYDQRPVLSDENEETSVQILKKPYKIRYNTQLPASKDNKAVSILKSGLGHRNAPQNTNAKDFNSFMQNENPAKVTQPDNSGYYYVPPSSLFIEGRQQGKQKNPINKLNTVNDNNINVNSVPKISVYQNDITDLFSTKPEQKNGEYFTTDNPLYQQTSEIDYPEDSSNQNFDQSLTDKQNFFTNVPMENIHTVPVANIIDDNVVTSYSIKDNTEIDTPKETLRSIHRNNNAIPSIRNDIAINIYQSTTPLPPLSNKIQILRSNQYETTPVEIANTPYDEQGYPRTTPDIPATFEEVALPTFKPIYTEDDDTTNIQVDGFGRPLKGVPVRYQNKEEKYNQDTDLPKYYDNQPKTNEYFTTGLPTNKESENGGIPTEKNISYHGHLKTSTNVNTEPGLGFSENSSSEPKGTTLRYSSDETMLPVFVGEDFSGPKQPQKYDPETGYYY